MAGSKVRRVTSVKGGPPLQTKDMTSEEFIQFKRNTEKGNTFYLKAKEAIELEEQKIKKSFMNPQQLAIYNSKKGRGKMNEQWLQGIIEVKMMNELLKDNLLEVNKDMTRLFQQTYNF